MHLLKMGSGGDGALLKRGGAAGTVLTLLTEGVSCRSVPPKLDYFLPPPQKDQTCIPAHDMNEAISLRFALQILIYIFFLPEGKLT